MVRPSRGAAVLVLVPFVLSGCGGGGAAPVKPAHPHAACRTQGAGDGKPASSLRAAVAPYRRPGQSMRIAQRLTGTATVQLKQGRTVTTVITLVHTQAGWAPTSVARC